MPEYSTQEDRQARITTSAGGGALVLERFDAVERLSDPFVFTAEVRSEKGAFFLREELGKTVAVGIYDGDEVVRWFHGLLYEAELTGYDLIATRYRFVIRPWLAVLDHNRDSRIYQEKTAVEIIQDVFDRAGFSDYDFSRLTKAFIKREYCVQFRESDFAFVSRLMEEEGIYYFFDHEEDKHILRACMGMTSHTTVQDYEKVEFVSGGHEQGGRFGHMWSWADRMAYGAAKVTLRDYNFKNPKALINAVSQDPAQHAHDSAELYDYPAKAGGNDAASRYADLYQQQARAERRTYLGEGDCVALACGYKFGLEGHPNHAFDKDYLIVEAHHRFLSEAYLSQSAEHMPEDFAEGASPMTVSIRATNADIYWRPERKTPPPRPAGLHTAVVVGPEGEDIYVDEHSRVKVQFPWDRQGQNDDKSSCWMRVSQGWADAGYGIIFIPRIGQEVLIDFLDGDIDRPLIVGRAYNGARKPPYKLPDEMTKSTIKTETVGETGDYPEAEEPPSGKGFNELRFEDKGGSEEVYVHAQRLMKTWVRLDDDHKVGRDQVKRVGRHRTTNVLKNESLTVEQGDETRKISQGQRTTTIEKDDATTINTGNHTLKVSSGDQKINIDAGNQNTKVAQKISIDAGVEITLTVGGSSIKIDNTGVTIKGLMIKAEADVQFQAKAVMSEVSGDAMTTIKGGIVMIN